MFENEKYYITGKLDAAADFIKKLEAQDCLYDVTIGEHSTGPWIKITYEGKYKLTRKSA